MTPSAAKPGTESIAVIGVGNMGGALLRGFRERVGIAPELISICDRDEEKIEFLKKKFGVRGSIYAAEAVAGAKIIICALKPKIVAPVLASLRPVLDELKQPPLLISVAAGITIKELRQAAGPRVRLARVMPNVACIIGQGVSGIYSERTEDSAAVQKLFQGVGEAIVFGQESDLNVVTALGASGPAFLFVAIEALADGGVRMGLTREQALSLSALMVKGAASLILETGQHPAQLKDMVASPGGTTIAGLHELEKSGFRGALISAIEAAAKRAAEFGVKEEEEE